MVCGPVMWPMRWADDFHHQHVCHMHDGQVDALCQTTRPRYLASWTIAENEVFVSIYNLIFCNTVMYCWLYIPREQLMSYLMSYLVLSTNVNTYAS